jgi:hypothetical protein
MSKSNNNELENYIVFKGSILRRRILKVNN